jgi:hypothetical protein
MPPFSEYFSEENIINELCRARVKLAGKRHDAAFLDNMARTARPPHNVPPSDWGTIALDAFPGRREWHRFRARQRGNTSAAEVNHRALCTAVVVLRQQTPRPSWASKLDQIVKRIRNRALSTRPFVFGRPSIIAPPKEPGGHLYRPLATYTLENKIIEGLTARYLRTMLDKALLPSCMAFRCRKKHRPPPSTHDALAAIMMMRASHPGKPLFVAECDIKGFFDCVGHRVARESVDALIADATQRDPSLKVDQRAREILEAYLQSYSFVNNVRGAAQPKLQKHDPKGTFKWHERDLQQLYRNTALPAIGVPQGGALSCLIANAVLHRADKALADIKQQTGTPLLYLRYCDDMILISTDETVCHAAFQRYGHTLRSLRLPAHPPKHVVKYDKKFWEGKSNAPYEWSAAGVPWIQFVGYQIRYDGLVRIRPKSLKKQLTAVTRTTDRVLAALKRADSQQDIRRTAREIQHRLRQKLISMSVGRITLGTNYHAPQPMCWAAGFRGLAGRTICRNHLKVLDRHRERQIQRLRRHLKNFHLPQPRPARHKTDAHKYYGRPFSYWAQFP